jgi:S-methylmethionine-dependent homocysteine/selenocysteine methylase
MVVAAGAAVTAAPAEHLRARLERGDVVVIDGATGTELEARGVPMDDAAWCGVANLDYEDAVRRVHADYIRAGAGVVIANTFSTDRLRLQDAGLADRVVEVNRKAVDAALAAREEVGRPDVVVAASVSRAAAFTIDGAPRAVDRATLLEVYSEQARILADAGAELIALEMITGFEHGEAALAAARSTGLPIWLGLSAERAEDGRLACWQDHELLFDRLVAELAAPDLAAVVVMHTDVADVDDALEVVLRHWSGPVGVYPHVGSFVPPSWQFDESFTAGDLVTRARRWVADGARIVGGCCGLGPPFIEALAAEFG